MSTTRKAGEAPEFINKNVLKRCRVNVSQRFSSSFPSDGGVEREEELWTSPDVSIFLSGFKSFYGRNGRQGWKMKSEKFIRFSASSQYFKFSFDISTRRFRSFASRQHSSKLIFAFFHSPGLPFMGSLIFVCSLADCSQGTHCWIIWTEMKESIEQTNLRWLISFSFLCSLLGAFGFYLLAKPQSN